VRITLRSPLDPTAEQQICSAKASLLTAYQQSTEDYLARLRELQAGMAFLPKGDYDRLRHEVERMRLKSERARLALERHVKEHGC
jgi:hypothetical protein